MTQRIAGLLAHCRFADIPGGSYELGWRYDGVIAAEAWKAVSDFIPEKEFLSRFSERRRVAIAPFRIASTAFAVGDVLADRHAIDGVEGLRDLCARLDAALKPSGLRVPDEDELEAACGGGLFFWGMNIPDGIPYNDQTTFDRHRHRNGYGLLLNSDPYRVEVTRYACKLGDGGAAICGAYPWPIAWLSLATSWSLSEPDVDDGIAEFLGSMYVRPVMLS